MARKKEETSDNDRPRRKGKTRYQIDVAINLHPIRQIGDPEFNAVLFRLAGKLPHASGVTFGVRDLSWDYETEIEARAALLKLREYFGKNIASSRYCESQQEDW